MSRRARLFAWYRVIPLLPVAILGLVSFAYANAPSALLQAFYPLHYVQEIQEASDRYGLDPTLIAAVIDCESSWDADAESSSGALGLMQIMPSTARDMVRLGIITGELADADNLVDPKTNIEFGSAYLSYLIRYFNGSTDLAIAAYNAGLSHANDWAREETVLHNAITFPETQAYLIRVNNTWARYKQLYSEELVYE